MLRNCLIILYIIGLMVAVKAIRAVTPDWFGYVVLVAGCASLVWAILRVRAERREAVLRHD